MIIIGGYDHEYGFSPLHVISEGLEIKRYVNLPLQTDRTSMVLHNGNVLLCGGENNWKKCFQMDQGTWKYHSALNEVRDAHSAVTTQTATFVFGGMYNSTTYEYLPKDSTTWILGKNEIPGGFDRGCAIAVKSGKEIWLIGGFENNKRRILSFDVNHHTFKVLPTQLNVERVRHKCAFIPNTNQVMITGGHNGDVHLDSVEILDTEDGSVTIGSPMNFKRAIHGIGVVTINGEDRLAVVGGYDGKKRLDSIEIYNSKKE